MYIGIGSYIGTWTTKQDDFKLNECNILIESFNSALINSF